MCSRLPTPRARVLVLVGFLWELRRSMWVWEEEGVLPGTRKPRQGGALFRLLLIPPYLGTELVLRGI